MTTEKTKVIAASGELADALRKRGGGNALVVVSPPDAPQNESVEAEVLDLDAIRITLLALQYQHEQIMSRGPGCRGKCLWCRLPQEWRDWAKGGS